MLTTEKAVMPVLLEGTNSQGIASRSSWTCDPVGPNCIPERDINIHTYILTFPRNARHSKPPRTATISGLASLGNDSQMNQYLLKSACFSDCDSNEIYKSGE